MPDANRPNSRWSADELRSGGRNLLGGLPGMLPSFLVVALLACILVPLPTVIVDALLSLSLAGAVLLLVGAMRVRRTSDFLGFPSLLLLITLFRLALNVSTTRLILSQADAGRVIDAFASFVVSGDLIVGAVMFGIVTVIQYVVIARGAERVAEVGARFALDGMPGHQAAIDADLRAGVISAREAGRRRAELAERSNFHGAMDGSVRFVKGDAIAGLAITSINLMGGLAIGVGRMGYSWSESLDVYGRLTIGDGLLAQIPALLVSLAAGILVSRVDRESGREPARWLAPAMLTVPAAMLLVLAIVPGMPWLAFATTGVALLALALGLASRPAGGSADEGVASRSLRVCVSEVDAGSPKRISQSLSGVRSRCTRMLGLEPPPLELRTDPALGHGQVEIGLGERVLYRGSPEIAEGGSFEDALMLETYRALMNHADAIVDLQDIDEWVERAREQRPAVASAALDAVEPLDILHVVRGLLRERIALPPFMAILGVLADGRIFRQASARPRWPEHARARLASYWLRDMLDAASLRGEPDWIRPAPDAEEALLASCTLGEEGLFLSLAPKQRERWLAAVAATDERPPVILCSPEARPAFADLFRDSQPRVPVVAIDELAQAGVDRPADVRWIPAPT